MHQSSIEPGNSAPGSVFRVPEWKDDLVSKEKDLGARQAHHYYFRNGTMDFYVGWLLGFSVLGGMSPGSIYDCLNKIKDGDPASWVRAFTGGLGYQQEQARVAESQGAAVRAGHHHLAAATAARAALNMCDPSGSEAPGLVATMELEFQAAMSAEGNGLEPWELPFESGHLPAYVSSDLQRASTLFVVVGGGDTYREDLWFFGGGAALARGYAVLMADLPGQGKTPCDGLHFGLKTVEALDVVIRSVRDRGFSGKIVLCGWSGGGLFTAKYIELYGGIDAWIASTPIEDMARLFEEAMPALLRRNPSGWLQQAVLRIAGRMNPVLYASLRKYDWQFGPGGIAGAVDLFRRVGRVDIDRLNTPLLALMGISEAREGREQAQRIYDAVRTRQPMSALVEFPPASGADAHCQVNNLALAFDHIFEWLDGIGLAP
jgi:pimeloyl-ACP methyl ester carboxylesterase